MVNANKKNIFKSIKEWDNTTKVLSSIIVFLCLLSGIIYRQISKEFELKFEKQQNYLDQQVANIELQMKTCECDKEILQNQLNDAMSKISGLTTQFEDLQDRFNLMAQNNGANILINLQLENKRLKNDKLLLTEKIEKLKLNNLKQENLIDQLTSKLKVVNNEITGIEELIDDINLTYGKEIKKDLNEIKKIVDITNLPITSPNYFIFGTAKRNNSNFSNSIISIEFFEFKTCDVANAEKTFEKIGTSTIEINSKGEFYINFPISKLSQNCFVNPSQHSMGFELTFENRDIRIIGLPPWGKHLILNYDLIYNYADSSDADVLTILFEDALKNNLFQLE